jgi:hypothetical protein
MLPARKREQRALGERSDGRGLGERQIDTAVSPEAAAMLSGVFF